MTVFGKCAVFGGALLLVLLVSGFVFLLRERPSDLPAAAQASIPGSANSEDVLSSPSNDASNLPDRGEVPAIATLASTLLFPPSQAARLYMPTTLDSLQTTPASASGSASEGATVPWAPVGSSAAGTPPGTLTIPILMYHYVRVVTNPRDIIGKNLSVTSTLFAQQMQYLADHDYTTLTLRDVYSILAGEELLPARPVALTFDDGYLDFYTNAWPILKEHNFTATSYIITGFVGGSAYMTWDQIRELDATGMVDFGAHTVHHLDLQLLGPTRLWKEIYGSKLALEQQLGHPVTDFDYPSGEYNAQVIADVERAGFKTAVTTHYGVHQTINLAFTMRRVRVTGPRGLRSWIAGLP
jgi:peptidoglycan/xylan/chitin deacetylase (PgdA/CDA1 family)